MHEASCLRVGGYLMSKGNGGEGFWILPLPDSLLKNVEEYEIDD